MCSPRVVLLSMTIIIPRCFRMLFRCSEFAKLAVTCFSPANCCLMANHRSFLVITANDNNATPTQDESCPSSRYKERY